MNEVGKAAEHETPYLQVMYDGKAKYKEYAIGILTKVRVGLPFKASLASRAEQRESQG